MKFLSRRNRAWCRGVYRVWIKGFFKNWRPIPSSEIHSCRNGKPNINPATGLPMSGDVDVAGNPYGSSGSN